jgi:hypothetical protein
VLDTAKSGFAYLFYKIQNNNGLSRGDYNVTTVGAMPRRLEVMQKDIEPVSRYCSSGILGCHRQGRRLCKGW